LEPRLDALAGPAQGRAAFDAPGEPALDLVGGERQRGGDAGAFGLALRVADGEPLGGGERRDGVEGVAAATGGEPALARAIAAAGEVVGQRHRQEDAERRSFDKLRTSGTWGLSFFPPTQCGTWCLSLLPLTLSLSKGA